MGMGSLLCLRSESEHSTEGGINGGGSLTPEGHSTSSGWGSITATPTPTIPHPVWSIAPPSRSRAEPRMAWIQLCFHTSALDAHFTWVPSPPTSVTSSVLWAGRCSLREISIMVISWLIHIKSEHMSKILLRTFINERMGKMLQSAQRRICRIDIYR